ncbi:heme oxygenase [Pustulibacterium marinum]|uniref:Heme oxygenase n=1 Tax=Pustulibacterium marinum TaxID=1224947 RepID=A0A1I7HV89_9FLAO|nr:biliverdin-producing heme oxygenase [Pustulibacterium marinum]SFU64590.1 heme oxygenase [Pustulibacterium marinum]
MIIFDQLKDKTTALHQEAEKYNDASKVLDHSISKEDYKQLLITNYSSYKGLEEYLVKHKLLLSEELQQFASYKNSDRLEEDLKYFDVNVETIERPIFDFQNPSKSSLIGVLYVMEGSMMGGMMISKNLLKCDSLTELPTQCFFNRDVQDILKYWNDFKNAVAINTYTSDEIDEAIAGANKAFAYFKEVHLFYHVSEKK